MSSPTSSPVISVLMNVYNVADYLPAAIESIRRQTWTDWELILVDDGSTDTSGEVCQQAAREDDRIRLIQQANAGIPAALNAGLKLAKGEFLARMDADDLATPDRLQLQVDYLRANPDCVVVGGQAMQIDDTGRELGSMHSPLEHDEIMSQLWQGRGSAIVHSGCMMRTSAVREVGGYQNELKVCEDLDLFLRLSETGTLANLQKQVIIVRRHLQSISALGQSSENYPLKLQIIAQARESRGEPFDPLSVRKLSPPSSPAEAYANWMLLALRSGNWNTAAMNAWRTIRSGVLRPWLWPAILRRGLYFAVPGSVRAKWDLARTKAAVKDSQNP